MKIYTTMKNKDPQSAFKLRRINTLIINNSEQVANLLAKMMSEFGFTKIHTAQTALRAVQILREVKINLVIADAELRVPKQQGGSNSDAVKDEDIYKISGFDFISRLRQSPNSPNRYIPVVMLADALEKEQLLKARDAGVNEILPKPLSAPELCQKLEAIIDAPRMFITASSYKGPCRRRSSQPNAVGEERRKAEVRVIKYNAAS